METNAHGANARRRRRLGWWGVPLALAGAVTLCRAAPVAAASLSTQQLQVIGRAAAFLQPPPGGGSVAIIYNPADPASRQDAEAIAAEIGSGLAVATVRLAPRLVEPGGLGAGGFAIAIAAAGTGGASLGAAIRAAHLLCITADLASVQAGDCTMAVSTDGRVQIVLNHATAAASGISFAAAFRMMIREI